MSCALSLRPANRAASCQGRSKSRPLTPGRVMSDVAKTVRPDLVPGRVPRLDGLLAPLAACLDALEARVGALERRLSAVRLMTAADAAADARVNVETILRAVRAGELAVAGYVGRSSGSPAMPSRRRGGRWADVAATLTGVGDTSSATPAFRSALKSGSGCRWPARSAGRWILNRSDGLPRMPSAVSRRPGPRACPG